LGGSVPDVEAAYLVLLVGVFVVLAGAAGYAIAKLIRG
jgi:hypothetical protein